VRDGDDGEVTLEFLLEILDLDTVHWPLALVVHEPAPPLPLQEPLTVALRPDGGCYRAL